MKINKIRNNSKRIRGKKEATKELRKLQKKIKVARKKSKTNNTTETIIYIEKIDSRKTPLFNVKKNSAVLSFLDAQKSSVPRMNPFALKAFENKSHSSTATKKQINPKMLKKTELKKVQAEEKMKEDIQQSLEDDLFIPPSVSAESLLTSPVTSFSELKSKK